MKTAPSKDSDLPESKYFFILGLPRCRTAWLSTLLTVGEVFCFHELSGTCRSFEAVADRMASNGADIVGDSDNGAVMGLRTLMSRFPQAKIVYVRRDFADSVKAFAEVSGLRERDLSEFLLPLERALDERPAEFPGLEVAYKDLNNEGVIRTIFDYVTDGLPFPTQHYAKMKTLRVVVDPELIRTAAQVGGENALTDQMNLFFR